MKDTPLLHVYGQYSQHDTVYITGNRAALRQLAGILSQVSLSDTGTKLETGFMTADGEGYDVHILLEDSSWQADYWAKLGLPYTGINYEDSRPNVIWPWEDKP